MSIRTIILLSPLLPLAVVGSFMYCVHTAPHGHEGDLFVQMEKNPPHAYSRVQFRHDLKAIWRGTLEQAQATTQKAERLWAMIRKEERIP